jgi:hypothetical protein
VPLTDGNHEKELGNVVMEVSACEGLIGEELDFL